MEVAWTGAGGATNLRPLHVGDWPDVLQDATKPNQTRETAQEVPVPCVVSGRIAKDGQRDFYRFRVDKAQKLFLDVFSRRVGTPMDPELVLYDAKGGFMEVNDDAPQGRDSRIQRDFAPGEYTVAIRDIDDRGGPAFSYRLSIGPPQPRFRLIATPDAPVLARGKTAPLTVKIEREDGFDGEVTIGVEGLPPGVTVSAPITVPKDKNEGQLTLTASGEAAVGPVRLAVVGSGKAGERALKAVARTQETYNIQGTAFQRDLLGPILLVTEK